MFYFITLSFYLIDRGRGTLPFEVERTSEENGRKEIKKMPVFISGITLYCARTLSCNKILFGVVFLATRCGRVKKLFINRS